FKDAAELAALPERIEAAERQRDSIYSSLSDPAFLRDGAGVVDARKRLAETEAELERLMARWEELEIASG
ncbi:MAG TPA: ABC transporter C-terminal domain-containing protein, partial [Gemmatimonadaceae bacterium]|nr:ABC transporter C-terminal domain-containing protein [Gemmatimonadaceae bacterium]